MKKRLISMLLSAALFVTAVPMTAFAEGESSQTPVAQSEAAQETGIDYQTNGGKFAADYQAPDSYPAENLPTGEQITKAGYEFGGWYDNEELEGKAVTSLSTADHSGNVVLYAKWIERYYYVDIPQNVSADGGKVSITANAGGFYENDQVNVTVHSANEWQLKNGDQGLDYHLLLGEDGAILENDATVLGISAGEKKKQQDLYCEVTGTPKYTGRYTDELTFDVAFTETEYTINYEANGGTLYGDEKDENGAAVPVQTQVFPAGKTLNDLPVPGKKSSTFLGWCYDEACTQYVSRKDRLLSDVTLYASYTDSQALETVTMDTYARATDVAPDFTIQVTDKGQTMTTAQLLAACTIKNVTDSTETVTLNVTEGADHIFTVGHPTGWQPGCAYKLELKDDSLYFTGFDPTIREYDFTVYKEEVSNVELNDEIKYINTKDISDLTVNGRAAKSVSVAVMTVGMDGEVKEEGKETTGTFTYTKQKLKVGDQIAVYSGDVIPTMDMSVGADSDVSFFEITAVNGNQYTYRGSEAEDVLFVPDVLPLSADKDQDGQPDNNSVTVAISDLTFGDDEMSQALKLSSETTVDEGDYLALYTDVNSGVPVYGKITGVQISGQNYIIAYETVSQAAMQEAMDVYRTENVDGDELLEETDRDTLEEKIETQAADSGFTDVVVDQISQAAMETESFEELEKSLSEEMGADISVQSAGGIAAFAGASGSGQKRVEAQLESVKANLGTKLKHFDGNISGVHLGLEIGVKITIHVGTKADIEILITATFEQEVRVDVNVDGKAVWKVWGIFPYIADYRVTASLELYEYTGIGLNVRFKTAEQGSNFENNKLQSGVNKITEELKSMMENGTDYISDKSPFAGSLGNDEGSEDEISVSKSLAERYSEMLEDEADWVEIYNCNLLDQHIRVLLIIDIEVQVEFVVSANMNISLGMTYWYKNAKRYVFCLKVMDRSATSDTIDLCEEEYEFTVYAMGTLGLRAGVRLTVRVGLLSTKLASVGISAEVGGYAQVWGYLYYELKYTASTGRQSRAMGAVYLEIGIYLEIKFQAQALANAFTYSPTLYENQWPLYKVGTLENVMDFAYPQSDVKEIRMKRDVHSVRLPDDYFRMQYMDMKQGLNEGKYFEKIYEDDPKYFSIVMTNPAFSYDAETNVVSVNPGSEPQQDGEMIITWKNQEGSFNTKPITRRITLHWDELRDGYYIVFNSNGGSVVDTINGKYNTPIEAPAAPVRLGYKFAGWYADEELTIPYTIPSKMPDDDAVVYAKWDAADVDYTVTEYVEGTNGVYEAQTPVTYKAKTGSQASPVPAEKEGFRTPPQLTETVKADGSTAFSYYYARKSYTEKFISDGEVISEGSYKYGTMMPTPAVYLPGYEFAGWEPEVPETVPDGDGVYTAKWTASDGIPYVVKYYVQDPDTDNYELSEIETLTGTTGSEVTAPDAGYDTVIYHLNGTLPKGTVKADGSLVLKVYYDLNSYTLTYDAKGGTVDEAETTARPGEKIAIPVPERDGYIFEGWYTDEAYENTFDETMPGHDLTVYAKWKEIEVNYTVRYLLQTVDCDGYTVTDEEVLSAPVGTTVTPKVKDYIGFTAPEPRKAEVLGDGSLVVEYRYERNCYLLNLAIFEKEIMHGEAYYGAPIMEIPENPGYIFGGWYTANDFLTRFTGTMPARDLDLYAKWTPTEVEYRVWYYLQDVPMLDNPDYVLTEEETLKALAGSEVTPQPKEFEGFTTPEPQTQMVWGDGGMVVAYRYDRKSYEVTYVQNNGQEDAVMQMPYGSELFFVPTQIGYAFAGWYTDAALTQPLEESTMPAHELKLYAKWEIGKKAYQVNHYLENEDVPGGYELIAAENFTGTFGEDVTPEVKAFTGFTSPETQTVNLSMTEETEIVNYYYARNKYSVRIDRNDGTEVTQEMLPYDKRIEERPYRDGYTFAGWYTDAELTQPFAGKVPAGNISLYGKWEVQQVRYIVNHYQQNVEGEDYTLAETEGFNAETDTTVTPEVKQYDGFTSPEVKTGTVAGDGSLTIDYYYTRNVHTLTLVGVNESADQVMQAAYGYKIPAPSRKGYLFRGWYTDSGYTVSQPSEMPDKDLTVYAKWEAGTVGYKVEYLQEKLDGTYEVVKRISGSGKAGETVTPEVTETEGFVSPAPQTVQIAGDGTTTVRYEYPRETHTFTFKMGYTEDGQEKTEVRSGKFGSAVEAPTPVRTGYTFTGWERTGGSGGVDEIMPAEDKTFTAQWVVNKHKVIFITDATESITVDYGAEIPKQATPEKDGYEFTGWDKAIAKTMPDEDLVYRATWKKLVYTIKYNLDGGTAVNPTSYSVDSGPIKLKAPTRPGYTFTGWRDEDKKKVSMDVYLEPGSIGDHTYTALWKKITYTIKFVKDPGGTTKSTPSMQVEYSTRTKLNKNGFEKPGYTFKGWRTSLSKNDVIYKDQQLVSASDLFKGTDKTELILYPVWEANTYTISFDTKGGGKVNSVQYKYMNDYNLPIPTRYGCVFEGWGLENNGLATYKPKNNKVSFRMKETKNLKLYAVWKANNKYSYRASRKFLVTDSKNQENYFKFFVNGNQTSDKVNGDSDGSRRYNMNMTGLHTVPVSEQYKNMKVTVSFKIEKVKDGYADLKTYYYDRNGKKIEWHKEVEDLKKKNNQTVTYSYNLYHSGGMNVSALEFEFDAHGAFADRYNICDLKIDVEFSK